MTATSGTPDDQDALLAELRGTYAARTDELLARYQRSVSFGDTVVDRWERARRLGWAEGANVYDSCLVLGEVHVGERTWVGPYTVLDGSGGGLEIGATCNISAGVHIYTHDSIKWVVTAGRHEYERAPVRIGDHTYIGPHTVVTKGVTIGRHCVIGAHSLVNRDIPDFSVAHGVTAKVVGRVVLDDDGQVRFERLPVER
jgi:acetyltransferase-like isoleucine patch superfamily enzyme